MHDLTNALVTEWENPNAMFQNQVEIRLRIVEITHRQEYKTQE